MITGLQQLIAQVPSHQTALDRLLPLVAASLKDSFSQWVDGGAGIGHTSKHYAQILAQHAGEAGRVYCYEPLPENVRLLQRNVSSSPACVIRDAAISNAPGKASFAVPYRAGEGGGVWEAGSSWAGFLHRGGGSPETVEVRVVRLDQEDISRFDFVKLDLQGGEQDAIEGMGSRVSEAKIIYSECQLLQGGNSAKALLDRGFVVMYDRLQFGFRADAPAVPMEFLKHVGLVIDRTNLPKQGGLPLICWGHFSKDAWLDPDTLMIKKNTAAQLREAGVSYVQTDALAVNAEHWRQIGPLLGRLI
jgi:FkbM family methyltransferase